MKVLHSSFCHMISEHRIGKVAIYMSDYKEWNSVTSFRPNVIPQDID